MNDKNTSKLISSVQIIVSAALAVLITSGMVLADGHVLDLVSGIFPEMALTLGTLIPVLILRVKHRSQVPEGYLLPLFLLMISLQSIRILPGILDYSGIKILSTSMIVILERFFFMSSYTVLLFAAIQNMKSMGSSKTGLNITFALVGVFTISYIMPINTSGEQSVFHEAIFNMMVFLVMLCALATYLVCFVSDRESYHIKRFLTFLFFSVGNYLIITCDRNLSASITGTVLFVIGAIMLSAVSPKGY